MGRDTFGAGGSLRCVHDLGHLVFSSAAHVRDGDCVVSRRGRMVDLHPSMPRAVIDGDRVHLTGVRNFDYRARNDFTVRYEEREMAWRGHVRTPGLHAARPG